VNLEDLAPLAFFRELGPKLREHRFGKRVRLLRELGRLFVLEARDRPLDREYLMACARDIYRRVKKTEAKA